MPIRAPKACARMGCGKLAPGGQRYCSDHQRTAWSDQAQARKADPARHALDRQYWSSRWRKYTRWFLRNHPLCAECERQGVTAAAQLVDHIVPTAEGGDFWEMTNHQALCDPCHRSKSARETFARGRA